MRECEDDMIPDDFLIYIDIHQAPMTAIPNPIPDAGLWPSYQSTATHKEKENPTELYKPFCQFDIHVHNRR